MNLLPGFARDRADSRRDPDPSIARTLLLIAAVAISLLAVAPDAAAQIPPLLQKTSIDSRSSGRCTYTKGRITESFEVNTIWFWQAGTDVDLKPTSDYYCRVGCPEIDDHPEVINTKGEWQGFSDKNGNPIPLGRDDQRTARLGEILNDLVSRANSGNGLTDAVNEAKAAGCENAAFPSPADLAKTINKLLKDEQAKVLKQKKNNINHWVKDECTQQKRHFYQKQMTLTLRVKFIRHRVVEEHANAPVTTDTTVAERDAELATATFPDLFHYDDNPEKCCPTEPQEPKQPVKPEEPLPPHTREKPGTGKRTPTPTATKTPGGRAEKIPVLGPMRTITVAVVLPADSQPRETVSGRLVANPEDLQGIPGLKVVPAEVHVSRAHRGKAVLEGLVVDTGNGTKIPASDGFTVGVPALGTPIPISVEIAGAPSEKTDVPVSLERAPIPPATPRKSENAVFTALPIVSESGVIAIHGPFDGNSETTRVTVNGKPARVLAESPRATFVQTDNLGPKNHLVIQKGAHAAAFDLAAPAIAISSPRTTLSKGDAATFDVRVVLSLPESAWKAGTPAELYDIAQVRSEAPQLAPPNAGEAGQLRLTIKNDTPEIVSMTGVHGDLAVLTLTSSDFATGEYHYRGHLRALQTGTFAIEASIVPFLDEIPGTREELRTSEPVSNATPTPKPRAEDEESREDPNADNYGDDEPSEEELIREAEFEHVLEIFSADLKAARQALDKYERGKEYNDAFNATESIDKARKGGHPLTSEQIDKIWKDWGDARHKWDDLRDKFGKARRAAEGAYFKLPAGALKAIEHPLSFTPTFSGLPDADKLRQAYDYKLKEAEDRLKEQREERESRESN